MVGKKEKKPRGNATHDEIRERERHSRKKTNDISSITEINGL